MRRHLRRLIPGDALTRHLAVATLVNTFGTGLFFAISTLFFTRIVGLSAAQVGLGLTLAGGCGVAASVPIGRLADALDPKIVFSGCATAEALGLSMYPFVHSFGAFLPVVCVVQVADRGASTVRSALIATAVPPELRATTRAYLRAVTNVGIGAGAAVAAIALQADTRAVYLTMVLLDAATILATAVIMARLPWTAPAEQTPAPSATRRALTDLPYVTVTVLNGVISMQFAILEVGLPLWVAGHTHAPRVVVAAALFVNTVLVVVLQVRATRGLTTPRAAARGGLLATTLIAASCLLFGLAHGPGAWLATALLVAGVVVGALGEVLSSAAGWTLGYDLADPRAPGVYQGVYQAGFYIGVMVAPVVLTNTAIPLGLGGWLLLGAIFVCAGVALVPATRWAERVRAARAPVPVG